MNSFKITKGHNLKLSGAPSENLIDVKEPSSIFTFIEMPPESINAGNFRVPPT